MPASAEVKFFSSTMANAPSLSGTLGSLIAVLDACLVDGWNSTAVNSVTVAGGVATANIAAGHPFVLHQVVLVAGATPSGINGEARVTAITTNTVQFEVTGVVDGTATGTITLKTAPAGWVKAFAGTNKGAYKIDQVKHPDSTGMLVRIHHGTGYGARMVGYEAMTGIDTGTGPFPQESQAPGGMGIGVSESATTGAAGARAWFVVADDRMVYLGTCTSGDAVTGTAGPMWAAFGEYKSVRSADAFKFLVAANHDTSYTGATPTSDHSFCSGSSRLSRQFFPRPSDNLGGSVRFIARSWPTYYGPSGTASAPLPYPNGPDNGVYLCPLDVFEVDSGGTATHLRGTYPGVMMIPHRVDGRIVPDARTAYMDTAVAGYAGRVVGFYPLYANGPGVVAFDLTGPWEH